MKLHPLHRIVIPVLCALLALLVPGRAAEDATDSDELQYMRDVLVDNLPPALGGFTEADWQMFWTETETLLHGQSLEALAWFSPYVGQACAFLDASADDLPWADWLRQRLDYFAMAQAAVAEIPDVLAKSPVMPGKKLMPAFKAKSPTTSKPVTTKIPKAPPPLPQVSAEVEQRRVKLATNRERWVQRLSQRPVPENKGALVSRLKTVFKKEGIPEEWVWIAEAESSLNPEARSPCGAVGLFQLMPATAKRFGLSTGVFDERKHPEKNARAAAQYLKILYGQMGSWPLALAAYNAGEGHVGKLLRGARTRTFDAISSRLPIETQMYVPKVMALVTIREKTDPGRLPPPLAWWTADPEAELALWVAPVYERVAYYFQLSADPALL